MILLIDNYDSFTYNLYQYLGELGARVKVVRNDAITLDDIAGRYAAVVLSPGPGRPEAAGITPDVARDLSGRLPILGICLGHQAIGEAFGARIVRARLLMHGKTSEIHHTEHPLFAGLPDPFTATRYHSLTIDPESVPPELDVTATTDDGTIMGLTHKTHPTWGVQFHPESIMTKHGKALLANFLKIM